jgi:hypothetical protein
VVYLEGKQLDLKNFRPDYWNMLLLKLDENGLLVRRGNSDRLPTPCREEGIPSPPTSILVPVDVRARLQTWSASTISVSASSVSGSPGGSVPGVKEIVGRSEDSLPISVAKAAAAHGLDPRGSDLDIAPIALLESDDDSSEGSNGQGPGNEPTNDEPTNEEPKNDETPQDKGRNGESSSDRVSGEPSTTNDMG